MARTDTLKNFLTDIADKLREKLGTTDKIPHGEYDTKIDSVYEAGGQAERDEFWSVYTEDGMRDNCTTLFAGSGWNVDTFKPPKGLVIKPITPTQMFARNSLNGIDLVEILEQLEVVVDFSRCTGFTEVFYYTGLTRVGVIDTRAAANLYNIFAYISTNLKTVDLLILKDDGSQTFNANSFKGNNALESLTIQGVIGKPNINTTDFTHFNKATITSFINALSTTTSGIAITFSQTAVNNAFETSEGAADGSTSTEWAELIATKSNWTISLA